MARAGRHGLTDKQFNRIKRFLPKEWDRTGAPAKLSNRQVVHAALWVLKTGAPWRDIPRRMGSWNALYKRYRSWCRRGIWQQVLLELREESDDEWHSLDGSTVRAHQDAAGGQGGAERQAIGSSRGGKTTKIHARVDALGYLVALVITAGQVHDSRAAPQLIEAASSDAIIADKAYDSDALRASMTSRGVQVVIPCNRSRSTHIDYDLHLYKERHVVENFFMRIKRYRKIATRYAKSLTMFEGAVKLVAIVDWLR